MNVFAREAGLDLLVVDAGVNYDFAHSGGLIDAKVRFGTRDYRYERAMTQSELQDAIQKGATLVSVIQKKGSNVIGFGEMGIGNTSSASLIMSSICGLPVRECVGKGTGADDVLMKSKIRVLEEAAKFHHLEAGVGPYDLMAAVGGFEMVQMCGAMLMAAELDMLIMVDGFIATAAMLLASEINPNVVDYAIFSHQSDEQGHRRMLDHLGVEPLLKLGMRLGEGTGVAAAFPLVKLAVAFINDMASFESAQVSEKVS